MNKRVLVVEDDSAVNRLICRYLEQRGGFVCDSATSAAQCLSKLELDSQPDLILMDLELPDLDGVTLCDRIRRANIGATIPVVVITGYQQAERLDELKAAGAVACLLKPFSPRELLQLVQEITCARAPGAISSLS
jgi:two-component system response regulator RpaA